MTEEERVVDIRDQFDDAYGLTREALDRIKQILPQIRKLQRDDPLERAYVGDMEKTFQALIRVIEGPLRWIW